MRAIILEVRDGYAAALREDGLVVKTRQLAKVGETVELSEKVVQFPSQGRRIMRTAVAAALALVVTGGAYTYTNVAAASYVTLDTEETSVELSVNRMGRVVGVRALDENSSELAESLAADVRRMKVEDAVDAAMQRMDGASTVVAGVTGDTEKRAADLQEAVERGAERRERDGMELVTLEISRDERREAGERDMSAGRWAFERGGGRWREDLDDDDRDDIDDRDDLDDDDLDDDDRPAPQDHVDYQLRPTQNVQIPDQNKNQTEPDDNSRKIPENSGMQRQDEKRALDQAPPAAPESEQTPPEGALSFAPSGDMQPPQGGLQPPQGGLQSPQGNMQPPQSSMQSPPMGGGPGGMPGGGAPQ